MGEEDNVLDLEGGGVLGVFGQYDTAGAGPVHSHLADP